LVPVSANHVLRLGGEVVAFRFRGPGDAIAKAGCLIGSRNGRAGSRADTRFSSAACERGAPH